MAVVAIYAVVAALCFCATWMGSRAAITVAVAEVRNGRMDVTRGGLSPRVLADLREVVARPRIRSATVRIVRDRGRPRLEVRGEVSPDQLQRLRNVVGLFPLAQLARADRR